MSEPTQEDWADLYEASMAFRQAAPWHWTADVDLVAVESPSDGQVGYCAVLGDGGEAFGLAVFVGEEGLQAYRRLMADEVDPESLEGVIMLRSLSATWVDRGALTTKDRAVIRSLGLRFRGRNGWPLFRSRRPGYLPWYLLREEALLLTTALHQVLEVAWRGRDEGLDLQSSADEGLIFTRYYRDGVWLEEWLRARLPEPQVRAPEPPDAVRLQRLQAAAGKHPGSWEVGWFLVPAPIELDSGPPYLPTCVLVVETQAGMVIGTELLGPQPSAEECQEAVVRIAERVGQLPQRIRVATKEARQLLTPAARGLGISLSVGSLPMLEAAKEGLLEYMR